jgi:hypothetical protein
MQIVNKKVRLRFVGIDGNAFSLMGAWKNQATREKWTKEEMALVLDECMSLDYKNLLNTLSEHCVNGGF